MPQNVEHPISSVLSPEGGGPLLWRSPANASEAAAALKMTSEDLLELKLIDGIIPEPLGGAHRQPREMIENVAYQIHKSLSELTPWDGAKLVRRRHQKFLDMGRAA